MAVAMTNASTMTTSHPVVVQQPREPPSFHGSPTEDPENWLQKVERVRIFNRRVDEETFRYVFFYLEDAVRTWFENHESSLTDWTLFKREFLKTFATVVRKERAPFLLETRTQHPNEGVVIFVEEMKRLFRRADPEMTEEKLRFLLRGIKQELFACLVRNPPKTVTEFESKAAAMDKTLEVRTRQYDPAVNALVSETIVRAGAAGSTGVKHLDALRWMRAHVDDNPRWPLTTRETKHEYALLAEEIRLRNGTCRRNCCCQVKSGQRERAYMVLVDGGVQYAQAQQAAQGSSTSTPCDGCVRTWTIIHGGH
ncbi:uncharacterized protein LOC144155977 [Haemaphysalis longicornis]